MTLLMLLTLACSGPSAEPEAVLAVVPEAVGDGECGVCGMSVGEQPSPRAQVLHRGGERRFLCSPGELLVYLSAPGPLGAPAASWVEALPADLDPAAHDVAPLDWVSAESAHYVAGVPRRVMGEPLLSYAHAGQAGAAAHAHDGQLRSWDELWQAIQK